MANSRDSLHPLGGRVCIKPRPQELGREIEPVCPHDCIRVDGQIGERHRIAKLSHDLTTIRVYELTKSTTPCDASENLSQSL